MVVNHCLIESASFFGLNMRLLMLSINIIKNAELKTLPCLTPDSELNNIMYENIFYLLFYYTCTWII